MPSIAIDIDDVLASHVEAFIPFCNMRYGTHLEIDDYRDNWSEMLDLPDEELSNLVQEFQIPESLARFTVKKEAKAALEKLAAHFTLYVVTARRKPTIQTSLEWIDTHFPDVFTGVHFVPIWEPDNKVTKGDICRQIGADYLIDDLARHCNIAAEAGIKAILFGDYGWNRSELISPGVVRLQNWEKVLRFFEIQ